MLIGRNFVFSVSCNTTVFQGRPMADQDFQQYQSSLNLGKTATESIFDSCLHWAFPIMTTHPDKPLQKS